MSKNSLADNAVNLAKTPLGIIALFVLLAEAIAALTIGFAPTLSEVNQTVIVVFITLFPVLVVVMFWHILVNHNVKLYSPSEFPNHNDFLAANKLDPKQLLSEFKKDIIEEIESSKINNEAWDARLHVESQADEYFKAVEFIQKNDISEEDVKALIEISKHQYEKKEAERLFGPAVVDRLRQLDLVNMASMGAVSVTTLSEVAKLLVRIFF